MIFREKRLLKRLRKGERDACIALIDAHYDDVYRYLFSLCHHEDQAADLTQNTFAKAWQALGHFEGRSMFKTWLFGIARNEFLMSLRS